MGEYIYGLHHGSTQGPGQGMYLCSGRQIDHIFSLLRHIDIVQCILGSQDFLQGGLQTSWVAEEHRQ